MNWKFKDFVEIKDIEDLTMNVNIGAIDIAQLIFKKNTKEESDVYPYLKDIYEKITMEVDVGDLDIEMETFEVESEDLEEKPQEEEKGNESEESKEDEDEET